MKTVVITGADRNIGLELARQFLQQGWHVFAGRFLLDLPFLDELKAEYGSQMDIIMLDVTSAESIAKAAAEVGQKAAHVDMLVHNAAGFGGRHGDIKGEMDFSGFSAPFNINCLGAIRLTQGFLPLMQTGMRRLCYVSSEAGVVSVCSRNALSSYCLSKTALNMALRLMFNQLQPMGYTFRLYHPGWVRSSKDGRKSEMGKFEPWETAQAAVPQFTRDRDWEDRMVLIDNEGAAWPF